MAIFRKKVSYNSDTKNQVIVITDDIKKIIKESKIQDGTIFIYSLHTTLSTFIQEALEPCLCRDFVTQLTEIVENDGHKYEHTCAKHPSGTCKRDDVNGPSHVRQLLTNQNIVIDLEDGKMVLGQWQDIAVFELDGPRENRSVLIKIVSD